MDSKPLPSSMSLLHRTDTGTFVLAGGNFSGFLAPLTKDTFGFIVHEIEEKLRICHQTLALLDTLQGEKGGFDTVLEDMLRSITLKTGELLGADRTTIFLLDEEKNELWSLVAKDEEGNLLELRLPTTAGIAGEVATFKKTVNIPYDFYDDPRSVIAREFDKRNQYRTYSMLALPILNDEGGLIAVVQLINKLKEEATPLWSLAERVSPVGFSEADTATFSEFAPIIRLILESSRSFYRAVQKQRAANALMQATRLLGQSSLDLEQTLQRVMDEAKRLMHADRSTLWLIDREQSQLWTKIHNSGHVQEIRIPLTAGFAGQVAQTGQPVNIPFDLYDHPNSETSKQTDQRLGYRTCSLLCMPVFNADGDLIGVTQLINKKRQGTFPPYDSASWPKAPEAWKAGFTRVDQEFMQAFNIQAGVALQNAQLFATVKKQEQMQRDILRSLSNAVLATDKTGTVLAANQSAARLLGQPDETALTGRDIRKLITIKDNDFVGWLENALAGAETKARQQYYPEQTLVSDGRDQHSIHLSINTMADTDVPEQIHGALVVMDDISDEKRLKSTMYRYMTQELAERLLQSGADARLGGDRKDVSVLFSDIREYTKLTEAMRPEDVVQMLNEYFETMVDAIFKQKGTLDKYIGDAMMAVFGSPLVIDDHAWCAVQAAVDMRHRLEEFNQRRATAGLPLLKIGIGINSDSVISGNIGSSKRMEFTAIGDGVNLSSRLEGASKYYGCDIVISENTWRPCQGQVWARELDCIRVKGKTEPVRIYELIGIRTGPLARPLSPHKLQVIEHYATGRKLYLEREFGKANREFNAARAIDPDDKPTQMHIQRCWHFMPSPPPPDWDGVWTMTEK
ncbi:MAG: GAF domain-containing protein [Blastocatellia bacterium]|nr:GAF domain-containing protein [Blastocatellia bacterium]